MKNKDTQLLEEAYDEVRSKQLYALAVEQGGEFSYGVGKIPSLNFEVFRIWNNEGDGIYADGDGNVIVTGTSPEECYSKFEKWDASVSETPTNLKEEGTYSDKILPWFLSLKNEE